MAPRDPETLDAAAHEAAWRELDAAERAFPRCEHVLEWEASVKAARARHRAALAAVDAAAAIELRPAPSSLPLELEPADDGALFPLEAVA